MKSILEIGIDNLRDHVDGSVNRYPEVRSAERYLDAIMHALKEQLGYRRFAPIEEAINAARAADRFAAFRIGVTEGLKLANGVRTLIGSDGVGTDG